MATVAKLSVGTVVASSVYTNGSWSNTANAADGTPASPDNNTYATCTTAGRNKESGSLWPFTFSSSDIPVGSTINSVSVSLQWKGSSTSTSYTLSSSAFDGSNDSTATLLSASPGVTDNGPPTSDTTVGYALTTVPTLSQLNSGIYVRVSALQGGTSTTFTASLDYIAVTVDYTPPPPTVTTDTTPSNITASSIVFDTNSITNTGGENATVRGICYVAGSGGTPTTSNTVVSTSGSYSTGSFSATMTGLATATTYSVRAFATNSGGTGYGSTVEVTTSSQTAPTVALNAPSDTGTVTSTTPDLLFTGTDVQSDDIEYEVQVDTVSTFDSKLDFYSESNYAATWGMASSTYTSAGQSIVGNGRKLNSIKFYLSKTAGATGAMTVELYAHSGTFGVSSLPAGTALATATVIDASTLNTSPALVEFTFPSPYTLEKDNYYCIILSYSGSTQIGLGRDYSSPTAPGNFITFVGVYGWQSWPTNDAIYYIYTDGDAPLFDKLSATPDAAFTDVTNGADTHPFASGDQVKYTVQSGDVLTNGNTYYWRVRGLDPSGSNTYGAWSTTRSFTVSASSTTRGQIKIYDGTAFVAKPVKVWDGSSWGTKPAKRWSGTAWTETNY